MKKNKNILRREFIKQFGKYSSGILIGGHFLTSLLFRPQKAIADIVTSVYLAKNGTPAENVAKVFEMKYGGIGNFIGADDIILINPNGQWPNQGGSNCACCMGLIDLILNRPGGFNGEIIFAECTQSVRNGYWTVSEAYQLERNGPYSFNDMIKYYHNLGYNNVNGVRIWRNYEEPEIWPVVSGPQDGQGWVRIDWTSSSGRKFGIPYPIIRSPYSNKLIDLKNGIYDGSYQGQPSLKYIKVPTLNNHGINGEQDYAGVTSATKSFLGIIELGQWGSYWPDFHWSLHSYTDLGAFAVGEAIGAFLNLVRKPDVFMTTAEWVGWGSRWGSDATQAKTVALGDDPVSLDYYMCKNVLLPLLPTQQYFDPDFDVSNNNTRLTLDGCNSRGIGTTNASEIASYIYDYNDPVVFRRDIDLLIKQFRDGQATEQEVLDLIQQYNQGK